MKGGQSPKNVSNLVGLTPIVATSLSEISIRRFSETHNLVAQTMSVVVDQSEAGAFNARCWNIHTAFSPTNQWPPRRLGAI